MPLHCSLKYAFVSISGIRGPIRYNTATLNYMSKRYGTSKALPRYRRGARGRPPWRASPLRRDRISSRYNVEWFHAQAGQCARHVMLRRQQISPLAGSRSGERRGASPAAMRGAVRGTVTHRARHTPPYPRARPQHAQYITRRHRIKLTKRGMWNAWNAVSGTKA